MSKNLLKYGILGAVIGWAGWAATQGSGSDTPGRGGYPYPPPRNVGVPFAGGGAPLFPILSSKNSRFGQVAYKDTNGEWHGNMARAFKASRGGRWHAGIDLYSNPGDIVIAPEDGTIIGRQTFYAGTGAMLMQTVSGIVLLFGETKMGGADEFGVRTGSKVKAGQKLSRIGLSNTGSHMLHFETYTAGTKKNSSWQKGKSPPPNLLDPTDYLLRARARLEAMA